MQAGHKPADTTVADALYLLAHDENRGDPEREQLMANFLCRAGIMKASAQE